MINGRVFGKVIQVAQPQSQCAGYLEVLIQNGLALLTKTKTGIVALALNFGKLVKCISHVGLAHTLVVDLKFG
jgi:hypothetical protein